MYSESHSHVKMNNEFTATNVLYRWGCSYVTVSGLCTWRWSTEHIMCGGLHWNISSSFYLASHSRQHSVTCWYRQFSEINSSSNSSIISSLCADIYLLRHVFWISISIISQSDVNCS